MLCVKQDNERRIELLELNSLKRSVVFTGFKTSMNKRQCVESLQVFMEEEMEVNVNIEDIFYLSKESTSPMVITFASVNDKRKIFANVKKIKELENSEGKPFIFSDYLPPAMNDMRRREREILENITIQMQT